jgi:diguanylate cyclase (GGDEF)-like protein
MQYSQDSVPAITAHDGIFRGYPRTEINQAFNEFLRLSVADQNILQCYRETLANCGESFAKLFYDYLMETPATAEVLQRYQAQGGYIDHLIGAQTKHLCDLIAGRTDEAAARHLENIGRVHHRFGIDPVWIMGAYKLYHDYLQSRIRSIEITEIERAALENAIIKLLFRDMGLMLEGYWNASLSVILHEQEKSKSLENQMGSLLANIPQLLWSIDTVNNKPLYVSPNAYQISGMDIDSPIPCMDWTIPEHREMVSLAWERALRGETVEVESQIRVPDGTQRWFRRIFYPYRGEAGEVVRIDGIMEDTTDSKATLERLNQLATTDSLTGLTNRARFQDSLVQAIVTAKREGERRIVVMVMDLNHFKEINDTLGHPVGDALLVSVTRRLQPLLRAGDTLARLGGDEFGILLTNVDNAHDTAARIATEISRAFIPAFSCGDHEIFLEASIGIAVYPEHGNDVATLMRHADVAMYANKYKDSDFMVYHAGLDPGTQQRLQLSGELRHALARNQLLLHYQPKIDLGTRAVVGAEALIRWIHPEYGMIPPDQFIPMAERTGTIKAITAWVMDTAVKQCAAWRGLGHDLHVAVNISARVLQSSALIGTISDVLKRHHFPPQCLEIELTENTLMTDIDHISALLGRISDLGVTIAIDDFGTGYSSLAYLKKLPLDTLKVDKSFVMDMVSDENDAAIVRSTIDLAHNLGFDVVAEGIEDLKTLELLIQLGCDGAQGYHFGRPLPPDKFLEHYRTAAAQYPA